MATKIRLARHGKKDSAFFHIVVADSRYPRDGRFIEKLGTYNPNTNPATIDLNFESALSWISKGAQPTDTVRAILSYKGVMLRNHLNIGVQKGAITEEAAQAKFDKWMNEKQAKIDAKVNALAAAAVKSGKEKLAAEVQAKEAKAKIVAEKLAAAAAAKAEETAEAEATEETPAEEAPAEEA